MAALALPLLLAACSSVRELQDEAHQQMIQNLGRPEEPVAMADLTAPRTLQACYELALKRSPAVQSAALGIEERNLEVEQARRVVVPRFSVRAMASPKVYAKDDLTDPLSGGVFLSFDFSRALLHDHETRSSLAAAAIAQEERRLAEQSVAAELIETVARMVLLQQQTAALEAEVELQREGLAATEKLVATGIEAADPLLWRTNLEDAEERASLANRDLRSAEAQLILMLGAGVAAPGLEAEYGAWLERERTSQPPRPVFTDLVGLAWTCRPDVRIAGLRSVMAADQVTIARWSLIRSADLSFGAGHIENPRTEGYVRFLPVLSLELPLFDAGDFKRRVALAKLQSRRSQLEIERVGRSLPQELGAHLADLECQSTIFEQAQRAATDTGRVLPSGEDGDLRHLEQRIFAARVRGKECASRLAWTHAWVRFKLALGLNPLTATGLAAPADHPGAAPGELR